MNVQGKCGGFTVKTEMFKFVTTDYSTPENITTEYVIHDTNRQVSMELPNFNWFLCVLIIVTILDFEKSISFEINDS